MYIYIKKLISTRERDRCENNLMMTAIISYSIYIPIDDIYIYKYLIYIYQKANIHQRER